MITRFLLTFGFVAFCVPCFAEEKMPTVPELIKKMYDYRMAIDDMQVKVTMTCTVDTKQPIRETMQFHIYFAYNKGRVRCDKTEHNSRSPKVWFEQYLSTPEFYFIRHPAETPDGAPSANEGNNLYLMSPREQPVDTFDPRRIGTDRNSFDAIFVNPFNYDTLIERFYPANAEKFNVSIDLVDGEKLYKITYQFDGMDIYNSYWLNPQKGYNLVRSEAKSDTLLDVRSSYVVTLNKYASKKGEIWFPQQIIYYNEVGNDIMEERIILDSVTFDVQDETPFTLVGLEIPVGYRIKDFRVNDSNLERQYWDGKKLVDKITYDIEPVSITSRKAFWIVNAIGFALIALWILLKLLRRRSS